MPRRVTIISLAISLTLGAAPKHSALGAWTGAQDLQPLEGRMVVVKIDLPGTQLGVDVYPGRDQPLDMKSYSQRLKDYGTALSEGDRVLITKVKVNKDHIEVQLGGGGYGTMRDDTDTTVMATPAGKSRREKDLEDQLRDETDARERRRLRERLDDLRDEREREDGDNRAMAAEASARKAERVDERRGQGGSRFNIRYAGVVPAEAQTAEAVMAALARYVRFAKGS